AGSDRGGVARHAGQSSQGGRGPGDRRAHAVPQAQGVRPRLNHAPPKGCRPCGYGQAVPRRPCYGALASPRSESRSAPAGCPVDFRIKPDSCVACMACVRVCPADAVAVEGAIVRIVDEACTRCGLCLTACPHDASEALGDVPRALELALAGRAALILSVENAVYFYPATPNQVVNACYAAGFRTVHRGVLGDELVAKEYLDLWADGDWGTMIRSTCPVIVETVRTQYPELIPYLAPV